MEKKEYKIKAVWADTGKHAYNFGTSSETDNPTWFTKNEAEKEARAARRRSKKEGDTRVKLLVVKKKTRKVKTQPKQRQQNRGPIDINAMLGW